MCDPSEGHIACALLFLHLCSICCAKCCLMANFSTRENRGGKHTNLAERAGNSCSVTIHSSLHSIGIIYWMPIRWLLIVVGWLMSTGSRSNDDLQCDWTRHWGTKLRKTALPLPLMSLTELWPPFMGQLILLGQEIVRNSGRTPLLGVMYVPSVSSFH